MTSLTFSQVSASQPEAVDAAIAGLRYGSVCVNAPSIMGFCLTKSTWGAFPGGTPQVRACSRVYTLECFELLRHTRAQTLAINLNSFNQRDFIVHLSDDEGPMDVL